MMEGFKKLLFFYITVPVPILVVFFLIYSKYEKQLKSAYRKSIEFLIRTDTELLGGRGIPRLLWLIRWSVPTFYLGIYTYLVNFFYTKIHSKIEHPNTWIYNLLLLALLVAFLFSVYKPPVRVTKQNYQFYNSQWPKDELIFFEKDCTTCKLPRPARSKHCKYCGACFILYDHHCVWLNNCVGKGNFKWFYSFLVMNVVVLSYAMIILIPLLTSQEDIFNELVLFILCTAFDAVLVWFTVMNLRMIGRGMTTNEQLKFEAVQYLVDLGTLYRDNTKGCYYEFLPDEDVFVGMDMSDNRVQQVDRANLDKVGSMHEIDNVYDQGSFRENLKHLLYS